MSSEVPSLGTAPRLTLANAEHVALESFGITGGAIELPSERDQNFRITTDDGRRFVLKIANAAERRIMLEAENACMHHLAATGLAPALVTTPDGQEIAQHGDHLVRLITWIDGRTLGSARWRSEALLTDLGRALGLVDRTLESFDHPALHRAFHWDLAQAPALVERDVDRITDPALGGAIAAMLVVHRDMVAPHLPSLRRSAIHGDANDYNVLVDVRAERVTGLVDFGDMVFSHTVNDLAIAMAYASLGQADPLGAASRVAAGYHAVHPLTDDELAALFGLMAMRLCLSVSVAAAQQAEDPDRDYLGISQAPIRDTLPQLAAIHPRLAHYRLRDACGLPPVPHTPRVVEWLRAHADRVAPLTGFDLRVTPVLGLDLSAGSPIVASDPADNAAEQFTQRLFAAMREADAEIGVGGYNEARHIYATDAFSSGAVTDERRTVHIGVDVTMTAGAMLFAPLDGVVHGFEDAQTRLDYGPVIVLRHDIPADGAAAPLAFYTLYGHLDRGSLDGLTIGQPIRAGDRFAAIGAPPENGDWWPHVHFQIITDMLDVPCNFNGVAPASQRGTWLSLSPDPNLLLGIPSARFARRLSMDTLITMRRLHFGANVRLSYSDAPLQIVRGWMQYLFDEAGRTYIDAYNNVPHVGHAHPRVTAAVAAQLATLNTNTRYLHETVVTYAVELAACFPAALEVCFFTASGSEANELALRLARAHTGRRDLVVMDGAYHGHTTTLIDISPYKHAGTGGAGAPEWVHNSPIPDVYRGRHKADDPAAGAKYAREVGAVIDAIGAGFCGYMAETCPSVAGQIIMPTGFLPEVYRLVRAAGGVCIADEVQTGFGRIGTHLWAFEAHEVIPDIVVLGKPIANGYPMGAVVTTRAIADSFDNGMEFFSTFGGSTAACAAARATLHATFDEGLQANALDVGARLLLRLRELQQKHDLIGDVRGSGLFIGVELVRDRDTLEPASEEASSIVSHMRELGVLVGTDGPFHNVIKIRGPMPLTIDDADLVVRAFAEAVNRE